MLFLNRLFVIKTQTVSITITDVIDSKSTNLFYKQNNKYTIKKYRLIGNIFIRDIFSLRIYYIIFITTLGRK